jgi:hypothetical protein
MATIENIKCFLHDEHTNLYKISIKGNDIILTSEDINNLIRECMKTLEIYAISSVSSNDPEPDHIRHPIKLHSEDWKALYNLAYNITNDDLAGRKQCDSNTFKALSHLIEQLQGYPDYR